MSQTLMVGSCKPNLPGYTTIQEAVDAADASPGATVLVCPGTYAEQVSITTPLTLKGISVTPQSLPLIVPPAGGLNGGLIQPAAWGQPVASVIAVDTAGVSGTVTISGIEINGEGICTDRSTPQVGILYVSTSGVISNTLVRNLSDGDCFGIGMLAENDATWPVKVAARNNVVRDFPFGIGITAFSGPDASTLSFNVQGNTVSRILLAAAFETNGFGVAAAGNTITTFADGDGIEVGDASKINDNVINVPGSESAGILVNGSGARIIDNFFSLSGMARGVQLFPDEKVTVTSNLFSGSPSAYPASAGRGIMTDGDAAATISGNVMEGLKLGMDLGCVAPNLGVNTISNSDVGISSVPAGMLVPGTFLNVATPLIYCQ